MAEQHYIKRAEQLRAELTKLAYQYYVLDDPSVDDAVYDSLTAELKRLENRYPELITPDSPTQRIAAKALDKFEKYQHSKRMISIEDTFSDDEAYSWLTRLDNFVRKDTELIEQLAKSGFFVDYKMDGLACALHYQNGQLIRAVTRGDGITGEVVTNNVKTIQSVPLKLFETDIDDQYVEVRGEIIMNKDDFEALNERAVKQGDKPFMNPRNLAAGTIRQLDPRVAADRPLQFIAYDILLEDESVDTNDQAYELLAKLGFKINKAAHFISDFNQAIEYAHKFRTDIQPKLPFNTDGLVIKLNDRKLYDKLGIVGKYPRGAIAYKYPAETATAKVLDIELKIGRTGAITPVAVFEPVLLAGSMIQHASLHNEDEIKRLDIRIGDTAIIYKAGEIIPQVERVILDVRPDGIEPFDFAKAMAEQYPGIEFIKHDGEVAWRVKSGDLSQVLVRKISHFSSRGAVDIEGMAGSTAQALIEAKLVDDLADIYSLKKEDLLKLDRFGEASVNNLLSAIESRRTPELARFITGIGIRHIGAKVARDLANQFKSLDNLKIAAFDDLIMIDGIGEVVAASIVEWFSEPDNQKLLDKFIANGVKPKYTVPSGKLVDQKIVITGTLQTMGRDQARRIINELGGEWQSSVSKTTTYLVVGKKAGKSKLAQAKQNGVAIIDEDTFINMLS